MHPLSRRLFQLAVIFAASGIGGWVFNAGWSGPLTLGVIAGTYLGAGMIVERLYHAK